MELLAYCQLMDYIAVILDEELTALGFAGEDVTTI